MGTAAAMVARCTTYQPARSNPTCGPPPRAAARAPLARRSASGERRRGALIAARDVAGHSDEQRGCRARRTAAREAHRGPALTSDSRRDRAASSAPGRGRRRSHGRVDRGGGQPPPDQQPVGLVVAVDRVGHVAVEVGAGTRVGAGAELGDVEVRVAGTSGS